MIYHEIPGKLSQQFIDFLLFHSYRYILFVFRSSTIRTAPTASAAGMCVIATDQPALYSLSVECIYASLSLFR